MFKAILKKIKPLYYAFSIVLSIWGKNCIKLFERKTLEIVVLNFCALYFYICKFIFMVLVCYLCFAVHDYRWQEVERNWAHLVLRIWVFPHMNEKMLANHLFQHQPQSPKGLRSLRYNFYFPIHTKSILSLLILNVLILKIFYLLM